jgi:hypothetical protein
MMALATPANAVVETFATFTQVHQGASLRWVKTTTGGASGGTLYTTSSATATTPGATAVKFTYLSDKLGDLGALSANFSMQLTASNGNAAMATGPFLAQGGLTGSFSFIYSGPSFTIGDTVYSAGANLLSGTIGGAAITGVSGGTSGGVSASTGGGSPIIFTSDILKFTDTSAYDFALSLTQIAQPLNRPSSTQSLRNFRAVATGSFSADPPPAVIALPVPETATWAMMLIGFGAIGGALRSRRSTRELASF